MSRHFTVALSKGVRDPALTDSATLYVHLGDAEKWHVRAETVVPQDKLLDSVKRAVQEQYLMARHTGNRGAAPVVLRSKDVPGGCVVVAATGAINRDIHDVREVAEAAERATRAALDMGVRNITLCLSEQSVFKLGDIATMIGVARGLYVPLQIHELKPDFHKFNTLGIYCGPISSDDASIQFECLFDALTVARDIGEGDPERMSPPRVAEYVTTVFANLPVSIDIVDDESVFKREYPLFEAVNRAAGQVPRHRGRIMYLSYEPEDPSEVTETVLLVGKGVTYDTGGADIKAGGIMAGMSRDKCGAAAVAGFMHLVGKVRPKHLRVIGALSMVRNSVGSECYVADELIRARSGKVVRVGNTDAEGRMIMADVLCRMKEMAVNMINPHLYTIATLTGHAFLTVGPGYSIVMDNGVARELDHAKTLQDAGALIGDPFEISTIRREDFKYHEGKGLGEDVLQAGNNSSARTNRGHQCPAAFLIMASGLDAHGLDSEQPLPFSHLDIAGSAGDLPGPATGAPLLALAYKYLSQTGLFS